MNRKEFQKNKVAVVFHCIDEQTGTEWFDTKLNVYAKEAFTVCKNDYFTFYRFKLAPNGETYTDWIYLFNTQNVDIQVLFDSQVAQFAEQTFKGEKDGDYSFTVIFQTCFMDYDEAIENQTLGVFETKETTVDVTVLDNGNKAIISNTETSINQ